MSKLQFPDGFLWGTSTAAAQVETAFDHQWKNTKSKDGYTFLRTTEHELRREEDLGYIKQFGSVYRCGVDWSRLQRKAYADFDPEVVAEYQQFFQQLLDSGMQIMFVFHHFTNPIWFEQSGSWLKESQVPVFMDYALKCIQHFGEYAFMFNTFNEPGVYALNSYITGHFPPYKKNYFKGNKVLKVMGLCHDQLYKQLKQKFPEKKVGISKNTGIFFGTNFLGNLLAKFVDWWFIEKVSSHFEQSDFWGLSYYAYMPFTPIPITEIDHPGKLAKMGYRNDKMWGYYPQGLKEILLRFHLKYQKPIIITENGVCTDDDAFRQQSIKEYLQYCHEAIEEGVELFGYTHWCTWDNYEWSLGPTYRFGLVRVDFETMERKMTGAGMLYGKIAADNGFEVEG